MLGINKITPLKMKVTRKGTSTKKDILPGQAGSAGKTIVVYDGIPVKIKQNYSYKTDKFGDHVGGKVDAYFPKSTQKLLMGDDLQHQGRTYKVLSDPRQGLAYVVARLERLK